MDYKKMDCVFSWFVFLLGYWFIDIFMSEGMQWKLKVYSIIFVLCVFLYFQREKKILPKESYFWMIVVGILGLSYSEYGMIFPIIQIMVLIMAAGYLVICAGGNLLNQKKSSQWIIVDVWNALIVVPFYNFLSHAKLLASREAEKEKNYIRSMKAVLLGLLIAIPLLCFILPMLGRADLHFAEAIHGLIGYMREDILGTLIKILLSLPVTAYLFGLFYGSLHQKHTTRFSKEQMSENVLRNRIVPLLAMETVFAVICFIYIIFITLQGSYLFSAFMGIRPESLTYAEYARQGFFELCKVAILNLTISVLGNTFSKVSWTQSKGLKFLNILMSGLTILLIITAMSKMVLYISQYGLTINRINTMVFMLWLLITFVVMLKNQCQRTDVVRISLFSGTILYTVLCVLPVSLLTL